jgi:apolipoprotein N-acyltransferase
LRSYQNLLPAVLSSILAGLAWQIPQLAVLMWVALVPFFYGLYSKKRSALQSWVYCFTFGLLLYLGYFAVVWSAAPLSWPGLSPFFGFFVRLGCLIMICTIQAFWLGWLNLIDKFSQFFSPSLAAACLWVIIEACQSFTAYGFAGARLAISQYSLPVLIQGASLFGTLIISFLLVLGNSLLAEAWLQHRLDKTRAIHYLNPRKAKHYYLFLRQPKPDDYFLNRLNSWPSQSYSLSCITLAILLAAANILTGFLRLTLLMPSPQASIEIAVVENTALIAGADQQLKESIRKANPDLVLWPAAAMPEEWTTDNILTENLTALAQAANTYILCEVKNNANNQLLLIPPQSQTAIDWGLLPQISLEDILGSQTADNLLALPWGSLACLSNTESFFPNKAQRYAESGAQSLIILNQSFWLDHPRLRTKLLGQAVFRAIENHRLTILADGQGKSVTIDPKGSIIQTDQISAQLKQNNSQPKQGSEQEISKISLPLYNNRTFYSQFGDWPIIFLAAAILLALYLRAMIKE